jgi:ankyrin repeat protein
MIASQNGHAEAIKALIAGGADVNKARNNGATPVYIATKNGHAEAIIALIAGGADVNKAMEDGATPVYIAAQNGHAEAIKALIEKGADVNKARNNGATPLMIASQIGHAEAIIALIEGKADVNLVDSQGATPLMIASQNGHAEAIKALIEGKADVNLVDSQGATPLMIASQNGHAEAIKALIAGGADVNKARNNGATPLMIASQNGHEGIVKMLKFFSDSENIEVKNDKLKLFQEKTNFMQHVQESITRHQSLTNTQPELVSDLTETSRISLYQKELKKELINGLVLLKFYSYIDTTEKFCTLSKEQIIEAVEVDNFQFHTNLKDFYDLTISPSNLSAIIKKTPSELITLAEEISTQITTIKMNSSNSDEEFSENCARQDVIRILNICQNSLESENLENLILSEFTESLHQRPGTALSEARLSITNSRCIVS